MITAVAKPGFKFAGWEGTEQKGTDITLDLQKDITLTANFVSE